MQIGDENVHRVRALLDEVFGEENFVATIVLAKSASTSERRSGKHYRLYSLVLLDHDLCQKRGIYFGTKTLLGNRPTIDFTDIRQERSARDQ